MRTSILARLGLAVMLAGCSAAVPTATTPIASVAPPTASPGSTAQPTAKPAASPSPTAGTSVTASASPATMEPTDVVVYSRGDVEHAPHTLYAIGADGSPRALAPEPVNCCVAISRDGRQVAFETNVGNGPRVTVGLVRTDGSGERLLVTSDPTLSISPGLFLPDGRLLMVEWKANEQDGGVAIIDPAASGPVRPGPQLVDFLDGPLAVSPDGSKFLLARPVDAAQPGQLLVVNTDGSGQHPLGAQAVNVSDDPFWGPAASWSADGSRISFSVGPEGSKRAYIANADGSTVALLGSTLTGAQWSPLGDLLAFDRQLNPGGASHAVLIERSDGTGLKTLVDTSACCPAWSLDASRVVLQHGAVAEDLWTATIGGDLTQITHDPGDYEWYAWGRLP